MSIIEPSSEGVKTPPTITTTREGDGIVLTCECQWLRYFRDDANAREGQREHAKKCKGAPVKSETAPKRATQSDWTGREAATWIDQM